MINRKATIIPFKSMGDIELYSSIKQLRGEIENSYVKGVLLHNIWVRYEIDNTMYLFFSLINGKLFKITALDNYSGKLFEKIYIGMTEKELLSIDSSFEYDDFEEVYESKKGVFLETDPISKQITSISIYIKETENEDFELYNW